MDAGRLIVPFEVVAAIQSPFVITRHISCSFKFKESKAISAHISNQDDNSQVFICVKGLIDALIPDSQHGVAGLLDVKKWISYVVRERR